MFSEYIQAALARAKYEPIDKGDYCATVPGLRGVIATGETIEECRRDLIEVLEGWIALRPGEDRAGVVGVVEILENHGEVTRAPREHGVHALDATRQHDRGEAVFQLATVRGGEAGEEVREVHGTDGRGVRPPGQAVGSSSTIVFCYPTAPEC